MNLPIKSGLTPTPHDSRDYDLFKTKKLGGIIPAFPDNYSTDANLWMPDQNAVNPLFTPPVPSLPEGCSDYTQTDLCMDEDGVLYNPMDIENITHANANGGTDLRTSLNAVLKLRKNHPAYFNIQPDIQKGGVIDWFDAMRLAQTLGKMENRAVSVGTPWFPEFMHPVKGIIPTPNWSLTVPGTSISRVSWHNWAIKGWKTINGQVYLIGKPWIGKDYGDGGYCYFSRSVFNQLMSINGTAAFTLDKLLPNEKPETVDSSVKQWLVSFFTRLFSLK